MLIPEPKHKMTGSDFNLLTKDAVYAWRRGNEFLYVGSSGNAMYRVGSHNIIGVAEAVLDGDELITWPVESYAEAEELEAALNREFRPKYSTPLERGKLKKLNCITCGKKFDQRRWWQKYCSRACGGGRKI